MGNSNKKKIIIIISVIAVLAIILSVVLIFMMNKEPVIIEPPTPDNPTQKTASEKTIIDVAKSSNVDSKRNVQINIPKFTNLTDYAFQQFINNKMSETANYYQNEISVVADEYTPITTVYKYIVDYNRHNNDDYVSVVINHKYQTQVGGLRSNIWKDTYNIDVVRNREVVLKDLFAANVDYKKEIINEVNRQAKLSNYELVGGAGVQEIPDTQKFYIKDQELYIYFDPAAIAPYVYGELNFKMPYIWNNGKFEVPANTENIPVENLNTNIPVLEENTTTENENILMES